MDWSVPVTDPRKFNDPFAREVGWDCLPATGSSFSDHRLEQSGPSQMKFVITDAGVRIGSNLLMMGLALIGISSWAMVHFGTFSLIIGIVFGLGFSALGILMNYFMNTPVIFDKPSGLFWKGRGQPNQNVLGAKSPKTVVALNQIYALQLLTQRVLSTPIAGSPGSGANYLTYQLNIVMKDKTRINVVNHGDIANSRADAAALANFLSVSLWDAAKTETESLPSDAQPIRRVIVQALDNKDSIFRYYAIPQAIVGALLVWAGFFTGQTQLHLLRDGVSTDGRIIDYKTETTFMSRRPGPHGAVMVPVRRRQPVYMPIVEFEANGRRIRFQNRFSAGILHLNLLVSVLYDPANPSTAMIEESLWFLLPWAPLLALGFFFIIVSIKGWFFPKRLRKS